MGSRPAAIGRFGRAKFGRAKSWRFCITAVAVAAVGGVALVPAVLALNGQFPDVRDLSPAGITIDGSRADWDMFPSSVSVAQNEQLDRMGPLYLGGSVTGTATTSPFTQTIVGDIYARYDCTTQTLFVRVHAKNGNTGNELLLRTGSGNEFVVAGHTVGDVAGSQGAFAYITSTMTTGWEASFGPLAAGTYPFTARAVVQFNGDFHAAAYADSEQVRVGATCASATPSPTPTTTPTAAPTATPGVTPSASASPTGTPASPTGTPAATAVASQTPSATGGVAGATATPRATLPPTSTSAPNGGTGGSSPVPVLVGLAVLVLTLVVGLPRRRTAVRPVVLPAVIARRVTRRSMVHHR